MGDTPRPVTLDVWLIFLSINEVTYVSRGEMLHLVEEGGGKGVLRSPTGDIRVMNAVGGVGPSTGVEVDIEVQSGVEVLNTVSEMVIL